METGTGDYVGRLRAHGGLPMGLPQRERAPGGAQLKGWHEACQAAGMPGILFHDLRPFCRSEPEAHGRSGRSCDADRRSCCRHKMTKNDCKIGTGFQNLSHGKVFRYELVRMIGLEPTLPLQELEPKSSASANFATSALLRKNTEKQEHSHENPVRQRKSRIPCFARFSLADFRAAGEPRSRCLPDCRLSPPRYYTV